jgi:hypothetical protein
LPEIIFFIVNPAAFCDTGAESNPAELKRTRRRFNQPPSIPATYEH